MKPGTIRIYLFIVIIFIGLLAGCDRSTPIARVGNFFIFSQDLKEALADGRGPATDWPALMQQVNLLVEDKLKFIDAANSGLAEDSLVVAQVQEFESQQVYSYIVHHEIIGRVVTDKLLKNRYRQRGKEWHVRHIYLPANSDSVNSIALLKSLRSRILRGEDFQELAREFSKDSQTAGKSGDLGFVKWEKGTWGEVFIRTAAALRPGQVSDIVRSRRGFHLIKLEQVRAVDQPPFEQIRDRVEQEVIRDLTAELDSTYKKFRNKLETKYRAVIFEDRIDSLLTMIPRIEQAHQDIKVNLLRDPQQFLNVLTPEEKAFRMAEFDGGDYTFTDMLDTYSGISPMRRPVFNDHASVLEFLNRNVPRKLITFYGYQKGLNRRAEVKAAVRQERERAMAARAQRLKVDGNVIVTDEDLLNFYNENKHRYEDGARFNVQEIVVSDSSKAADIYKRALAGDDYDTLAREFNERQDTKGTNGVLGFIGRRDQGMIGRTAARLRAGEIAEPIRTGDRYSIIKIVERIPGQLKPFEEVRLQIRREQRLEVRRRLMNEWMTELKENYPVHIYTSVIKKEFETANE